MASTINFRSIAFILSAYAVILWIFGEFAREPWRLILFSSTSEFKIGELSSIRTALYPAFIEFLSPINHNGVVLVQCLIFSGSLLALWAALQPDHPRVALFIVVAIALNPRIARYPSWLVEEAIFVPILIFILATATWAVKSQKSRWIFYTFLLVGLLAMTRPTGWAFILVPMGILLFTRPRNWLTATLLGVSTIFLIFHAEQYLHVKMSDGEGRQSTIGINIVAKLPFFPAREPLPADVAIAEPAISALQNVHILIAQDLDSFSARQWWVNYAMFEGSARGINPALTEVAKKLGEGDVDVGSRMIAFSAIRQDPFGYFMIVLDDLIRYFYLPEFLPRSSKDQILDAIATHREAVSAEMSIPTIEHHLTNAVNYYALGVGLRIFMCFFLLVTIIIALSFLILKFRSQRPINRDLLLLFTISLGCAAYILGHALTINIQVRYLITIFPSLLFAVAMSGPIIISQFASNKTSYTAPSVS